MPAMFSNRNFRILIVITVMEVRSKDSDGKFTIPTNSQSSSISFSTNQKNTDRSSSFTAKKQGKAASKVSSSTTAKSVSSAKYSARSISNSADSNLHISDTDSSDFEEEKPQPKAKSSAKSLASAKLSPTLSRRVKQVRFCRICKVLQIINVFAEYVLILQNTPLFCRIRHYSTYFVFIRQKKPFRKMIVNFANSIFN